jgi:hypothetical protein
MGECHACIIGRDERCMPGAEEAQMENGDTRHMAIRLVILEVGPLEGRNVKEWLGWFRQLPSEDVTCCMPSSDSRMISGNG